MKKIILIIAIAFLGIAAAQAQDTVRTDFDFSIELLTDTVLRSNGGKVVEVVFTYSPLFIKSKVAFNYDVETYNITNPDTAIFVGKKREQAVLEAKELNTIISGKRVYEWLDMLQGETQPQVPPRTIIKTIGELAYYYKVEGGN